MFTAFAVASFCLAAGAYWCQWPKKPCPKYCINYCYDSDDETSAVISNEVHTRDECQTMLQKGTRKMWISINNVGGQN